MRPSLASGAAYVVALLFGAVLAVGAIRDPDAPLPARMVLLALAGALVVEILSSLDAARRSE